MTDTNRSFYRCVCGHEAQGTSLSSSLSRARKHRKIEGPGHVLELVRPEVF